MKKTYTIEVEEKKDKITIKTFNNGFNQLEIIGTLQKVKVDLLMQLTKNETRNT